MIVRDAMSDRQVMVLASSIAGIENDEKLRTALQGLSVCIGPLRHKR
jgi:hypothetical protein